MRVNDILVLGPKNYFHKELIFFYIVYSVPK